MNRSRVRLAAGAAFGLDAHGDGIELREAMDEAALLPLGYVLD